MDNENEILDLVDENDVVVGETNRGEAWSNSSNKYIRFVAGFLINDEGCIWVPIRSQNKKKLPGAYDWSFAGHVGVGESYMSAAIREASEELNINFSENDIREKVKLKPQDNNIGYFVQVYEIGYDYDPNFNTADFESGSWMTVDALRQEILNGASAKKELLHYLTINCT